MASKVTRKWANGIADGTAEEFARWNVELERKHAETSRAYKNVGPFVPLLSLKDLYKEGQTLVEVCAKLELVREEYFRACSISPRFKKAHNLGMVLSEAWWATLGRAGTAGKHKINAITWGVVMKNRFSWASGKEDAPPISADSVSKEMIKKEMTPEEAARIYNDEVLGCK